MEQNADIPVDRHRDKRSVEQNADFPVRRGDMRSVEQNAHIPVLRRGDSGGLHSSSQGTGSSQSSAAQNVDIPVLRRGNRGNLQGFHPGQGSSAFHGAEHHPLRFLPEQSSTAHRGADFRPRRVCTSFLERQWGGRGCAYGDGCTFAHSWAELHPEASASWRRTSTRKG